MTTATNGPEPSRPPAYRELAERVRAQIMSGELQPGDRLPVEPELSARYGVSRGTVREALRLLSSQNLVTTTRGVSGGSFVAHPNPDQISDYLETSLGLLTLRPDMSVHSLLEVREMFEVPAAGLAAQRRTDEQLTALKESLFDPTELGTQTMYDANRHFHSVLLSCSGNPLLEVVTRPVFRVLRERFLRDRAPARFWLGVADDHRDIHDRVVANDSAGAREATREHLTHLRVVYEHIDGQQPA